MLQSQFNINWYLSDWHLQSCESNLDILIWYSYGKISIEAGIRWNEIFLSYNIQDCDADIEISSKETNASWLIHKPVTSKPATQIITKYTCIQYMNWPDTNYCIQIHQNSKSVYTKLARRATGTCNSISISQAPPPCSHPTFTGKDCLVCVQRHASLMEVSNINSWGLDKNPWLCVQYSILCFSKFIIHTSSVPTNSQFAWFCLAVESFFSLEAILLS